MRNIEYVFIFGALVCAACSKYDDSKVWNELNNLDSRVEKLEALCNQMNTNISSLQAIVAALQGNDGIANVYQLPNGEGYTITFTSGKIITIYNGADGKDGGTPVVGVKKDTDGSYYWTSNGEWLTDDAGNKIRAEGADGVTPQLKIADGYWYMSTDKGATWTQLGKAAGEDGESFFSSVAEEDDYVVFTLNDGTMFSIKKAGKDSVNIINSIVYRPQNPDRIAKVRYCSNTAGEIQESIVNMNFELEPESAARELFDSYAKEGVDIKFKLSYYNEDTTFHAMLPIDSLVVAGSLLSVTASCEDLERLFYVDSLSADISLKITNGSSARQTEYFILQTEFEGYTEILPGMVMDGVEWQRDNLGVESIPQYGGSWDWDSARKSCPDGYRLPTSVEFGGLLEHYKYVIIDGVSGYVGSGAHPWCGVVPVVFFPCNGYTHYWTSTSAGTDYARAVRFSENSWGINDRRSKTAKSLSRCVRTF